MNEIKFLDDNLSDLANGYLNTVLFASRQDALKLIMQVLEQGMSIQDTYLRVFQPCQYKIGDLWETGQIHVAQEHYFTSTTQLIISQLYSYFPFGESRGKQAIISCALGAPSPYQKEFGAKRRLTDLPLPPKRRYNLHGNIFPGVNRRVEWMEKAVRCR